MNEFAQCEEAAGAGYIEANLGAEGFGAGPLDLRAEVFQEAEADRGGFVEVDGVEVENVGLDSVVWGAGDVAEGGAIANVGDGFKGLGGGAFADGDGGDVDAIGGEELGVRGEVDGRDGVFSAVAAA